MPSVRNTNSSSAIEKQTTPPPAGGTPPQEGNWGDTCNKFHSCGGMMRSTGVVI